MGRKEKKQQPDTNETKRAAKSASRARITDCLAFAGLTLAALLIALGPLLQWILEKTGQSNIFHILNMLAQYSMLAAIAIPAWYFVRRKRMGWKIFYLIILGVYIAGTVLGVALL